MLYELHNLVIFIIIVGENDSEKLPLFRLLPNKRCKEVLYKKNKDGQLFNPDIELCGGSLVWRR